MTKWYSPMWYPLSKCIQNDAIQIAFQNMQQKTTEKYVYGVKRMHINAKKMHN